MTHPHLDIAKQQRRTGAEPPRLSIATVAELASGVVTLRRAGAGPATELTKAEREQLLQDAVDRRLVSLDVDATTFLQRETPNRSLVRFSPKALRALAPSFAGMPVLRDHEQNDALARGGTIVESNLEDHPTEDGVKQIAMTLRLTAPWAVELALRGLMSTFSIGWHSEGDTVCSICSEPMTRGWLWTFGECEHELGTDYDGQICQLEYTDAVGVEVSAVSVPAVVGTGIDDIRAQLQLARAAGPAVLGRMENRMRNFDATITHALALSADADEPAVLAAIGKLQSDLEGARAAAKEATERATGAETKLAELAATGKAQRIASLLAGGLSEGRYLPGGAVAGHVQKLADKGDEDGLAAYLADLPARGAAPIGGPRQSAAPAPPATGDLPELTASQKKLAADLGVTEEAYAQQLANKNKKGAR